ncbi:MAG: RagB/SusD family nutrient uptake outer membrane protein, partial [Bacteroidales bacterium]|nr:RagB/SusD family nutrient uptake outer membrane protein [Bacteroidales bacterium]
MLLVLSATSCGEWLNLSPEDGVTREDFWQSKEQVESAVIGIYCEMMNTECVNRMFLWGELRADMVIDGTKPNAAYTAIRSGEIASDNVVCKWSDFYSVINNCNLVLEYADQAVELDASYSQQEAELFKAEAKALRAMMYFYLTRSFGDVPMVLEASVSDDQDYHIAKTSQDSILDQIIFDLTEAERVMETNNPAYNMEFPKGRMTVWAVKALLADAYLWKGNYDAAIQRCDAIINSEEFVLISVPRTALPGVENLYFSDVTAIDLMFNKVWATGNSEESIFELNFDETKTNGFYNLFASARNVLVANVDYIEGNYFPLYELDESVYDVRSNGYSYQGTIIWKYMALTRQGTARTSQQS